MARARSKRARSLSAKKGWRTRRKRQREREKKQGPSPKQYMTFLISVDYPKRNKKGKVTGHLFADIVIRAPFHFDATELADKARNELPKKYEFLAKMVEGEFASISILESDDFRGKAKVRRFTRK
jgi:hypothetical protein